MDKIFQWLQFASRALAGTLIGKNLLSCKSEPFQSNGMK